MSVISIIVLIFLIIGAIDYLFGSKLRVGKEFEKGFMLLGTMALSMLGMIVIAPLLASWLSPVFDWVYKVFSIDPSIIPSSLFANDMGGAPLAMQIAKDSELGNFNGLVVSSMMGATISFTIPFAIGMVQKEKHSQLAFGLLCGIVTIPLGCFVAGLICQIPILTLLGNLLPLVILAVIIALGLIFCPNVCVKIFKALGYFIKALVLTGLILGIINFLAKSEIIKGLGSIEEGAVVCLNASVVIAGMLPLLFILSKLFEKPMKKLGGKINMNEISMLGLVSTLATNVTTFAKMNEMDDKGVVINSAFAVSAAFTFAGHLAFTMAIDSEYILPVIVGKLVSGILAVGLAFLIYKKPKEKQTESMEESEVS